MPSDDESSNNTLYLSGDEWLQSTEDEGSLNSIIQPCQVEPIALLMWKNET